MDWPRVAFFFQGRFQLGYQIIFLIQTKQIELDQTLREEEETTMKLCNKKRKLDTKKKHLQN